VWNPMKPAAPVTRTFMDYSLPSTSFALNTYLMS